MARNAKKVAGNNSNNSNLQAPDLNPGAYPARVVGVVFLGVQEQQPYQGQAKDPVDMVRLTYELSDHFMQDENGKTLEDKPRWFSEEMPFYSLNADRAKSTRRYLAIDPSDTCDGDFDKLLGKACQVVLVTNPGKGKHAGKTFTNVGDVTAAPNLPGYEQPALVNPVTYFDPQDDNLDVEVFRKLPEYLQTKITGALDYAGSPLSKALGGSQAAPQEENSPSEDADEML